MIVYPVTELGSKIISATGLVYTGGSSVSAITIYGGTGATGATVILDDSTDGSGTAKWEICAPQYGCTSVSFPKPIPFTSGIYATLTGTASKVSIAYA